MRILFLNHNYRNSGTYYRAMPIAEHMAQRGHDITLMVVSPEHRWRGAWSTRNGVHLGEMPHLARRNTAEGYGPLDIIQRSLVALTHQYDIIHMFDHKPNASFPALAGRMRGARLIADWADWWGGESGINQSPTHKGSPVRRFEQWWEEKQKLLADGVVTISTVLEKRAIELGCPPERVLYLPSGAAIERIRPLAVNEVRTKIDVPLDRRIVGFIGYGQGDLEIVMAALRALPDVWLMVIGKKNAHVLEQAKRYGIAERLWQTGFVPDEEVGEYLACADLMCLPLSDSKANHGRMPNKILDYMSAGRATVASPIGDIKTIVEQHQVGLLANQGSFGQAIEFLLNNKTWCEEMGRRARWVAEKFFSWPVLVEQLEEFYSKILDNEIE